MRRILPFFMILAVAAVAPRGASAQLDLDGATSISFSGFLSATTTDSPSMFLNTTVGLNKFVGSNLELGGFLQMSLNSSTGFDGETTTSTSGFAFGNLRYNVVGEGMSVPFFELGAGAQIDDPGAGSRPVLFQYGFGVKHFLSENASFDWSLKGSGSMIDGETDLWSDQVFGSFGMTVYIN